MLPELAMLMRAKLNAAPVKEATTDILPRNMELTLSYEVKLDCQVFWTHGCYVVPLLVMFFVNFF